MEKEIGQKWAEILSCWTQLHQVPEISTQEFKTAEVLKKILQDHHISFEAGLFGTGIVASIDSNKPGKVLGLRADMDGLLHYVEGQEKKVHSCGHDAHMTMVLYSGILAQELNLIQSGKLKLLFQPSEEEESTSGARALAQLGVTKDMDYLFGMHLRPIQDAVRGKAIAALKHSALHTVTATIKGKGSHAGRPHLGKNPIDALACIITGINSIWVDPFVPSSAKLTAVHSDSGNFSSIPEEASLRIDLRASDNETMALLLEKVCQAISAGAACNGCHAEIQVIPGLGAAQYDDEAVQIASDGIDKVLGKQNNMGIVYTTGAEDFHEYVKQNPNLKTGYMGLGCNLTPGLHDPFMTFEKEAMKEGIQIFLNIIERILGKEK